MNKKRLCLIIVSVVCTVIMLAVLSCKRNEPSTPIDPYEENSDTEVVEVIDEEYYPTSHYSNIIPTEFEMEAINRRLPMEVAPSVLFFDAKYDEGNKMLIYNYIILAEIDKRLITRKVVSERKAAVLNGLKKHDFSVERLKIGISFLYVYYDKNYNELYKFCITKTDL